MHRLYHLENFQSNVRTLSFSPFSSISFSHTRSACTIRIYGRPSALNNFSKQLSIVLQALQQMLSNRPTNLQILEDKSGELDPDGVHFSLMAGILFVQDLHDQAVQLMLTAVPDPKIR